MGLSAVTYALSKKYTDETASQFGGLKGAPCKVKSVVKTDGQSVITLEWKNDEGETRESEVYVNDGLSGWESGHNYSVGDIIIYHGETNTEHSMTIINTNGTMRGTTVYGQGGLEVNNHIDKANEAWSRPDNYLIVRKQYPDRIATENEIQQFINSIPNE